MLDKILKGLINIVYGIIAFIIILLYYVTGGFELSVIFIHLMVIIFAYKILSEFMSLLSLIAASEEEMEEAVYNTDVMMYSYYSNNMDSNKGFNIFGKLVRILLYVFVVVYPLKALGYSFGKFYMPTVENPNLVNHVFITVTITLSAYYIIRALFNIIYVALHGEKGDLKHVGPIRVLKFVYLLSIHVAIVAAFVIVICGTFVGVVYTVYNLI